MDKVICDICGTSYPASADQCPICGCEKAADPVFDEETAAAAGAAVSYTPVKGGRFSNANVRKRNKGIAVAPVKEAYDADEDEEDDNDDDEIEEEEEGSSKGLVVVLILLIVAILALILYLYFNFFAPIGGSNKETDPPVPSTTAAATTEATETEEPTVPCTGLEVSETDIVLDAIGNAWLLNVVAAPADTTDTIVYTSNNESVATVTSEGCVTAVGPGEAVITVNCGSVTVECKVTCTIETEPETEPTTEPTTEPELNWGLNRTDFTLYVGERWPLYEGDVSTADITFKSKNNAVVTISKSGVVTGVGPGNTVVTAEYNGVVLECIVFCRAPKNETSGDEVG